MLWAFKLHGCVDCGVRYPDIPLSELHCDHRDPESKNGTRSRNVLNGNAKDHGLLDHNSHDALMAELLKCDVVCVECHKKRTRERRTQADVVQYVLFNGTGEAWRI